MRKGLRVLKGLNTPPREKGEQTPDRSRNDEIGDRFSYRAG